MALLLSAVDEYPGMSSLNGVKAINIAVNETKKTAKKLVIKNTFKRVDFNANRSSKVSSLRITNLYL